MTLEMKVTVLVCFILKACVVSCQNTLPDNATLPDVTSPSSPSSTAPSSPSLTSPTAASSPSLTSPTAVASPSLTSPTAASSPSLTSPTAASSPSLTSPTAASSPSLTSPTAASSPSLTSPTAASSPSLTSPTTAAAGRVTEVQCNYTDSQASSETVCLCPDAFTPTENITCVKETDLMPMNVKFEATETSINVTWTYMLSPWNISSQLNTSTVNTSRSTPTNGTKHIIYSSVPGQKVNIAITPILNGKLIGESAVDIFTTFKPAMPGTVVIPAGGYDAPNSTIRWKKSAGVVDNYQIHMTLLCPAGAPTMEFQSNMPYVSVTGLKHGREYRLKITAMSGNITSDERAIAITIAPDPPENVTILPPIQPTSVRLAIYPVSDVNCPTILYYRATILNKDQEFKQYITANISINQTDQSIDNLVPGTMYVVWIVSVNRDFSSKTNVTITFRTAELAPGKVQNVTITDKNTTSVHVRFDRPSHPNGVLIGYVLGISSQVCSVLVMRLTADFHCGSVIQGQNETYGDCNCTTVNSTASLEFVVLDLLPYTKYMLTLQAHNSAGAGLPVSADVTTAIGAPHIPGNVATINIKSNEVTVTWTYDYRNGPTNFSLEVTDEILLRTLKPQRCTDTSCKAVGLKAHWKYSFVVIAETTVSSAKSESTGIITTLPSRPGPVRNLTVKKWTGPDCTKDKYGVIWTEPRLEDRHGIISRYIITSSLISHSRMTKEASVPTDLYQNTNTQFTFLFAETGSTNRHFDVSVMSLIKSKGRSEPRTVPISIPKCSPGMSSGVTAAVTILVLICIIAIIILLVMLYRWDMFPCLANPRPVTSQRVSAGPSRHIKRDRPFTLGSIKQLVDRMKKDTGRLLILEWTDLNSLSPEHATAVAQLATNVPKNRYNNILPFDRSRVKLCGGGNDYINANYIPGYKFEREYIACQGPLPTTIADFWQMVWEQDVPIIVMLTSCKEGDTVKCEQYWPEDLHESVTYGAVAVTRIVSEQNNAYVYSEFTLTSADHEKSIKHFHFQEWPDFGAAVDFNVFLDFLFRVKSEIHDDLIGPIVVHCSAGVGRTGTYLAVDYLTEYVETHDLSQEFDIFQRVLNMRQHRTKMVQAKEQYLFIHECLRELVKRQTNPDNLSNDGCQMPSEEEYSEQLFGASNGSIESYHPGDKLMIEEDNCNDDDNSNVVGYDNPSMTTEL